MREVCGCLILLAAVYGAADVLCRLVYRLWFPSRVVAGRWVIPVSGDGDTVEYDVRHARMLCRFLPCHGIAIVVLDEGVATEYQTSVRQVCERLDVVYELRENEIPKNTLQDETRGV